METSRGGNNNNNKLRHHQMSNEELTSNPVYGDLNLKAMKAMKPETGAQSVVNERDNQSHRSANTKVSFHQF